jgi:hypothetical protein
MVRDITQKAMPDVVRIANDRSRHFAKDARLKDAFAIELKGVGVASARVAETSIEAFDASVETTTVGKSLTLLWNVEAPTQTQKAAELHAILHAIQDLQRTMQKPRLSNAEYYTLVLTLLSAFVALLSFLGWTPR